MRLMNIDWTMTLALVAVWCATACTSSPGDKGAVPGQGASIEASRSGLAPQVMPAPDSATRAAAASQPSAPSPDYSALIIDLRSAPRRGVDAPAALLVTTPDGRRAGLDTAGHRIVTEIERGGVDSSCPDEIDEAVRLDCTPAGHVELQRPDSGMYTIGVIGMREGAYALTVLGYDAAGKAPQIDSTVGMEITPGEVHRYQLHVAKVRPNVIVLSRDSVGAPR